MSVKERTGPSVREETHSPTNFCALCQRPIEPHERPSIPLEGGGEAHLLCWSKAQDSAPRSDSVTIPEAAVRQAWEKLCAENTWPCRVCGALPPLGQPFEGNLCEDCKLALGNYDPTVS